jgi:hypothetical protein
MKKLVLLTMLLALAVAPAFGVTDSKTSTVTVNVGPEAAITINTADAVLAPASSAVFADYVGETEFTYFLRAGAGGGFIQFSIATDFTGTPGTIPVTALSYVPTVAASGTAATGASVAVSTNESVATFAADAHSAKGGDAGSVAWTLVNDPSYKEGKYSTTVTWTISAT